MVTCPAQGASRPSASRHDEWAVAERRYIPEMNVLE